MPWSYCRGRRAGRIVAAPPYRLNDEFIVPDANPLNAQPRICEPGPGTLFWQDLDGRLSVNFGALTFAGASGAWDRTYLYSQNPFARRAGRFLEFEWTPANLEYLRVGWQKAKSGLIGDNLALMYFGGGGFVNVVDDLDVVSPLYPYTTLSTSYLGRVVDTGEGFLYYVQDRTNSPGVWTLLWRKELSPSRLDSLYPAIQNIGQQGTMQFFRVRNGSVPPPSALVRQPAQGQDACGAADGLFEVQFAVPAAGAPGLVFRKSDAGNFWKLVVNRAGGSLDLVKVVGGAATVVASTAVAWTTGTWVRPRALTFGDKIRTWLGLLAGPTATDAFNQTAALCGTLADVTYSDLRCDTGGTLAF
jgi:hypothetical protein